MSLDSGPRSISERYTHHRRVVVTPRPEGLKPWRRIRFVERQAAPSDEMHIRIRKAAREASKPARLDRDVVVQIRHYITMRPSRRLVPRVVKTDRRHRDVDDRYGGTSCHAANAVGETWITTIVQDEHLKWGVARLGGDAIQSVKRIGRTREGGNRDSDHLHGKLTQEHPFTSMAGFSGSSEADAARTRETAGTYAGTVHR